MFRFPMGTIEAVYIILIVVSHLSAIQRVFRRSLACLIKGFSLLRLVIKTNREHSTFTGVSFSFYLLLCQHTHTHTHIHIPPHLSQRYPSCIASKFHFCFTPVQPFFLFCKAKTHVHISTRQKWHSAG